MISVVCKCGKKYQVDDQFAGKRSKCKGCGEIFQIPAARNAAPEPEREPEPEPEPPAEEENGEYDIAEAPPEAAPPRRMPESGADAGDRFDARGGTGRGNGLSGVASRPCDLEVSWPRYFFSAPTVPFVFVLLLALGIMAVVRGVSIGIALMLWGFGLFLLISSMRSVWQKLHGGDVNAGIIISMSPPLVAVGTGMQTGGGRRMPAVCVKKVGFTGMVGGPAKVGTRVAGACIYFGPPEGGVWLNFDFEVLQCVSGDKKGIEQTMASIPESAWRQLEEDIKRLPSKQARTYTLWDGNKHGTRYGYTSPIAYVVVGVILFAITAGVILGKVKSSVNAAAGPKPTPVAPVAPAAPAPIAPAPQPTIAPAAPVAPSPHPIAAAQPAPVAIAPPAPMDSAPPAPITSAQPVVEAPPPAPGPEAAPALTPEQVAAYKKEVAVVGVAADQLNAIQKRLDVVLASAGPTLKDLQAVIVDVRNASRNLEKIANMPATLAPLMSDASKSCQKISDTLKKSADMAIAHNTAKAKEYLAEAAAERKSKFDVSRAAVLKRRAELDQLIGK